MNRRADVLMTRLIGTQMQKFEHLSQPVESLAGVHVVPMSPDFAFIPQDALTAGEYEGFVARLISCLPTQTGLLPQEISDRQRSKCVEARMMAFAKDRLAMNVMCGQKRGGMFTTPNGESILRSGIMNHGFSRSTIGLLTVYQFFITRRSFKL